MKVLLEQMPPQRIYGWLLEFAFTWNNATDMRRHTSLVQQALSNRL